MTEREQVLLDKAERTLKANIYPPNKFLWGKYRMISPSPTEGFTGIWNWDAAFHAIGMLDFDHEIAKEQILGFCQFQTEDGMFPDAILESGYIEDRLCKPPVMASAAAKVYKYTGDMDFLKEIYPKLVKNEAFWVNKRLHDGMFHYDSDKSRMKDFEEYKKYAAFESGWDNSPRWDDEPFNCWAIDLNCYMVMTYRALAYMAGELGEDKAVWEEKEKELTELIENRLWNEELKSYTDYNFNKGEYVEALSPASFMPLFIGIAPCERADCMNEIAKKHFLPGMPTIAYDHPEYSTKYWRGPCWLNVAYFAAKALKDYGYTETAETVRNTILDWVYNDGEYIHENYNSTTGEGLYVSHFSWSSVFVRKFILDF